MKAEAQDFLQYLDETVDSEYGDFKRRTDLRLLHFIESQPHLTSQQVEAFWDVRHKLLWSQEMDSSIEDMKKELRGFMGYWH